MQTGNACGDRAYIQSSRARGREMPEAGRGPPDPPVRLQSLGGVTTACPMFLDFFAPQAPTEAFVHCSSVSKLLALPLHPPYTKGVQLPLLPS